MGTSDAIRPSAERPKASMSIKATGGEKKIVHADGSEYNAGSYTMINASASASRNARARDTVTAPPEPKDRPAAQSNVIASESVDTATISEATAEGATAREAAPAKQEPGFLTKLYTGIADLFMPTKVGNTTNNYADNIEKESGQG